MRRGMARSRLFRREHHHHLTAFHRRLGFDLRYGAGLDLHAFEQTEAEILMGHFATAKAERHLDLVAFLEEAAHGLHLGVVVVIVDAGAKLDLLDLDDLLLLAGFGGFLLLKEAELPIVEDLADRRICGGNDLDEVEACVVGYLLGFQRIDDFLDFGLLSRSTELHERGFHG